MTRVLWMSFFLLALGMPSATHAAPRDVSFFQSAASVEAYDFVEITASVAGADAPNPFTDATLTGTFGKTGAAQRVSVDGFCDSADGSVFRIRFMPASAATRRGRSATGHRPGPLLDLAQVPVLARFGAAPRKGVTANAQRFVSPRSCSTPSRKARSIAS